MPTTAELLGIVGPQALWKLQYAERGKSKITEVAPKVLSAGFAAPPWYGPSDDGTGVTMVAPVDGPTTPGSEYSRCETREELEWDSSKGGHRLSLWMRLDRLPDGAKTSLLQLHDGVDDQIQLLCERTAARYRLWWSVGLGKGKGGIAQAIDGDFKAAVWIPLVLEVVPGRTALFYGHDWSTPRVSTSVMRQSKKTYTKFGPYCQVRTPKGETIAASFRRATLTHSPTAFTAPPERPVWPTPGQPEQWTPFEPPAGVDPAWWSRFMDWVRKVTGK